MIRKSISLILCRLKPVIPAVLLVLVLALPVAALEVPALEGRVNDFADMITDKVELELDRKLAEFEKSDSTQIVILTIPSLEGDALENFSIKVAESWKIGRKGFDNGVIVLAVKNDRKIRIEVGYGLEGKMTDLVSGRIIDTIMKPAFRAGDYDRGFIEAADAIVAVSRGEFKAPPADENNSRGAGVIFLIIVLGLFFSAARRWSRSVTGAVLLPLAAASIALPLLWSIFLVPVGALVGFILHPFLPRIEGGSGHFGGFGGGFSGGGFGGGFSGGGGGFGGGGASGSW